MSDHETTETELHEALLARERGETSELDLSAYDRLTDAISERAQHSQAGQRSGQAGAAHDFDDRLWAAIDQRPVARHRWATAAAVFAAAAAVLLAVWFTRDANQDSGRGAPVERLAMVVERGEGAARRGTEAQPGDRLRVAARADATHIELRLYRDDTVMVLACTDAPPCSRDDEAVRAILPLARAGVYQLVVLRGPTPAPAGTGNLDADVAAAMETGSIADTRRVEVK